ncbi:MAG: glutamine--tRNA ligase, partial [Chitinophagaceae bacterium]
ETEMLKGEDNPEDEQSSYRDIPFSRELYIEQEDFMELPPKKFFRLAPGQSVRLKSAYIVTCQEVTKDEEGKISEVRCTYLPESKSGSTGASIKVQGTLHWVSIPHAVTCELREYDRLFKIEDPSMAEGDYRDYINEDSLRVIKSAYGEPALLKTTFEERYQFLRKGYFCLDKDSSKEALVFNRTVTLKDTWAKVVNKG